MLDRVVRRSLTGLHAGSAVALAAIVALSAASHPLDAQQPTPSAPQQAAQGGTYTVKRGDTLWDLAKTFLGDAFLWPDIYRLNREVIEDPHWIYPGEVLRMPGAVIAAAPGQRPTEAATTGGPTIFAQRQFGGATGTRVLREEQQPAPAVRYGEAIVAPFVEREGGPRGAGRILQSADRTVLPIDSTLMTLSLYDEAIVSPPAAAVAPEGERYLSYELGPDIEGFGQVVLPTGILEIVRAPRHGEAAVARVLRAFGQVRPGQRLIPFDSAALVPAGHPTAVTLGRTTRVKWIASQPLLPAVQAFLVLDLKSTDGVKPGDQFQLFAPRQSSDDPGVPATPELPIGRASAVRVTPYGTTVVLTGEQRPRVQPGTSARVSAKMP